MITVCHDLSTSLVHSEPGNQHTKIRLVAEKRPSPSRKSYSQLYATTAIASMMPRASAQARVGTAFVRGGQGRTDFGSQKWSWGPLFTPDQIFRYSPKCCNGQ